MIVGAYWNERAESRESVATRLSRFLADASRINRNLFGSWFAKGNTRRGALRQQVATDPESLSGQLRCNRRDFDGDQIPELGYAIGLWNGGQVSLSATIGSHHPHVGNAVVLSLHDAGAELDGVSWRALLEAMVRDFEPNHAVVTSHAHLQRTGVTAPWQAGWFTYDCSSGIREHSFDKPS